MSTVRTAGRRSALMVQLGGLYGLWLREVKRAFRDRGQLIGGVSRPILWVLILGIGLNPYFRGEVYGEVTFVVPFTYLQFIFPAVIALNIMFTSVQSAVSVIWDREFGFLREVLVSPLSRATVLLGKILGGTTVAVLHGCLVLILARFADVPLTFTDVLKALGLMFLLAFALTSLGVVIANRIRSFEGFGIFSNAVILPLYFTSSSIFPLDPALSRAQTRVVYPDWLVTVVEWNPLTYAVDALRGVLINYHQFTPWMGITVMLVGCVVLFSIALYARVAILGRHPDGNLRDLAVYPDLPHSKEVIALRFDGRLYFANVPYFEDAVLEAVASNPEARTLLVIGDGMNELDASGEEVIHHIVERLRSAGVEIVFSGLKKQVRDVMQATGLEKVIGAENFLPNEDAAFDAIAKTLGEDAVAPYRMQPAAAGT